MFNARCYQVPELRALIETALEDLPSPGEAAAAVRYAMFPGGKRIRPVLTLLAAQACGGDVQAALPAACAVEYLHCASLIWDDMPCMDNASERRGVSAVHVSFGEGMATLAALSLLNRAYAIFGLNSILAEEAGTCVAQMIEGQAADLRGGPQRDHRKTIGLMRLTLTAGAITCEAPVHDVAVLARCGECLGEAYQIFDDFKDGDSGSQKGAEDLIAEAKSNLQRHFGACISPLHEYIDRIASHFATDRLVAA